MNPYDFIKCEKFPCIDINRASYIIPNIDLQPEKISIIMISESAPENLADYYYANGQALFQETTVQAFNDAGVKVASIQDIINQGVYLTTAIKCGKTHYNIYMDTVKHCSVILEKELSLFPNAKIIMLMGEVATKALNYIAKRLGEPRVIPTGSTYKIRENEFYFQGKRVFPSYLQAGPSFYIEKSKQRMIAEDIANAFRLVK
jgi:uracil-DNA glycosylase